MGRLACVIDLQLLRNNPEIVQASQAARGASQEIVEQARDADARRREALTAFETLRSQQKEAGMKVKQATPEDRPAAVQAAQELAAQVKTAEAAARTAGEELDALLMQIDNIIIDGIPAGGEENFETLHTHGEIPEFDFEARDHLELGEMLGAIDMERGTKVSGARFYFLRGVGARLELALMNLAMNLAIEEGFTPMITPTLVRPDVMSGTGFLGEHAAEVYHLAEDDLFLTGTSEVALAGYHADEIIDLAAGPLRYAGWSTCYRREAGSHGKDTRGILRVHQFNKLEMFVYTTPEAAEEEHARLLAWQERMLTSLGLTYRVIDVAAGDLGSSAARKYDIEAWIPTQGTYRELTSTSNCTTFQARRLKTRHRGEDGKTQPVATLNGTLATTRWLVALLETHQRADGSVVVPEALRPYMGGIDVLEPIRK